MPKLIVASNSPRRQQLIEELGFSFDVKTLDVDESIEPETPPTDVAELLAIKKNQAYRAVLKDEIVLTADTVVIAKDSVLGKPKSREEAIAMINSFNNGTHQVVSGVCISSPSKLVSFSETTTVRFSELTSREICYYVDRYQPFDKAGSYGIQEWLGMIGIKRIEGSYFNVMGLPVHKVYQELVHSQGSNDGWE